MAVVAQRGLATSQQRSLATSRQRSSCLPVLRRLQQQQWCKRQQQQQQQRCLVARAFGRGLPEEDLLQSDCPVPSEQQPIQELRQLQEMFLFDWATMPVQQFAQKLLTVWAGFFLTMAMPVSAFTFDLHKELLQCVVAASAGSSFIVTVLVWRLFLGWQHVGDRLISATVEYEETGWYDGQVWVKTPQVLMRDRLMSNYTVKPALARLKRTLLGLGGSLVVSMLLLAALPPPPAISSSGLDYYSSSSAGSYSGSYASDSAARYEPWAAGDDEHREEGEGGEGEAPARFDIRSHMMMVQQ